MTLYAIAVKHESHGYFNLEPRLYLSRSAAEEHACEVWAGVPAVEARLVTLTTESIGADQEGVR
jgi:hypothetical protein